MDGSGERLRGAKGDSDRREQGDAPDRTVGDGPGPVRVALVGAGNIADIHAAALKSLSARLTAVVDPSPDRARELADRHGVARVVYETRALIDDRGDVDCAHVLVPPPLHAEVAVPLLEAGIDVLVEKPMAETDAQCGRMQDAAAKSGAALRVNQNFVFHPAYARLAGSVRSGAIGPLRHVECIYSMPLRQLAARQFGHWMFASARNLLLEQAVHPLSQIVDLVGWPTEVSVRAAAPRAVDDGVEIIDCWGMALGNAEVSGTVQVALGAKHPVWRLRAVGDDGEVEADVLTNRVVLSRPTRWIDAADQLLVGLARAGQESRGAARGFSSYALATAGVLGRRDPFYLSMRDSLRAFYRDRTGEQRPSGDFGRGLVALCEDVAGRAPRAPAVLGRPTAAGDPADTDVVLLGGTGFIGRHTVERLKADGYTVTVVARTPDRLPAPFHDERVKVVAGSMADRALLDKLLARRPVVVNLAHGGGSGRTGAERAMVDGAMTVANAALASGVPRLVHVSSIAALDLGDPKATVTGATRPDPKYDKRGDYARAKVLAEKALFALAQSDGLPLTVVRPGVVLGAGTSPFHSGVGFFNRETHCIGWNQGRNPLPLVLAQDVASAIGLMVDGSATPGLAYNLVGDVRLSAREYIAELARRSGRPLRFHPSSSAAWHVEELAKWLIKRASGRKVAAPSLHDFRSRALAAGFDTADVRRDLGWVPEGDQSRFLDLAFADV